MIKTKTEKELQWNHKHMCVTLPCECSVRWVKVEDIKNLIIDHELCKHYHRFDTPEGKGYYEESCLLSIMRELSQSIGEDSNISLVKNISCASPKDTFKELKEL